ncbi:dihydroorotate dehydrogenase electron transfer subunit [Desulfuribacillus alkaliarsenatis]|uniref:FAD-binding FR-type domain-containing protein n=1 Tax=Desulfuribacillus alkaliarsenatis TaxID=766136 RepID=A0A1E5G0S3_9FIRM|nr:dihydroorotate dehydrogenase electron transfer subunit [Desulfuribacillus alkaliarsenatis]OEF96048.1 hypothetical protein BHF68_09915 [Desulfuribacillus alkaliarsenatis]
MRHITKVLRNNQLAENIFDMEVYCPELASTAQPGQFAHIRIRNSIDPLLRRPISICDVNKEQGTVRFVYRKHGYGTTLLSELGEEGIELDVLAPLGNGKFPVEIESQQVYLIGGGIGVPPLLYAAKQLANNNIEVHAILGFASKNQVILEEEFKQHGNVHVYTIDGSYGNKGLVTDYFSNVQVNCYCACGPKPMLRVLMSHPSFVQARGYLSFEEHMACGIGACMGCVTKIKALDKDDSSESQSWKYAKICDCGPVFTSEKVVFE